MCAHARVDSRGLGAQDVRVEDVHGAEADGGEAGIHFLELVVVVGYMELAGVFGGVAVGVADEGTFPVAAELVPGDGDHVRCVSDV